MNRTNPNVYPVTASLEDELLEVEPTSRTWTAEDLITAASDYLVEYEHGSVDVSNLGATLNQVQVVLVDFLLTTITLTREEDQS